MRDAKNKCDEHSWECGGLNRANVTRLRKVVVRLWGEETRRFHTDVTVEVPESVADEQIERLALRQFDGVASLEWTYECSTGIWPGNCGRRIQPQVIRAARMGEAAGIRLLKTARGRLVVQVSGVGVESA